MSKLVINIAFPCYIVYHMPNAISWESLVFNWYYPVLGAALLAGADIFGYVTARIWAVGGEAGTFRMLTGLPNWVFMALAVAEPLYGLEAVRVILLFNVGIQFYLWSFGMTSFRGGLDRKAIKDMFLNIQIIASVIGLTIALAFPGVRGMERLGLDELGALPFHIGILVPVWETLYFIAMVTLPLSIMQIGLQLALPKSSTATAEHDRRNLVITTFLRLFIAPLISLGMLIVISRLGFRLSQGEFVTSILIMSMPAAVTCISISEMYGGNNALAAKGVLWTTILSLGTAPVMNWIASNAYAWA